MLVYHLPCTEEHNTANTINFTTSNIIALEEFANPCSNKDSYALR